MRRAARLDVVQPEIVDGLLAMGYKLQSLSAVGMGVPDLLVKKPDGTLMLLEVKTPGGTLTPAQKRWMAWWGPVPVVETLDEAIIALERT